MGEFCLSLSSLPIFSNVFSNIVMLFLTDATIIENFFFLKSVAASAAAIAAASGSRTNGEYNDISRPHFVPE